MSNYSVYFDLWCQYGITVLERMDEAAEVGDLETERKQRKKLDEMVKNLDGFTRKYDQVKAMVIEPLGSRKVLAAELEAVVEFKSFVVHPTGLNQEEIQRVTNFVDEEGGDK